MTPFRLLLALLLLSLSGLATAQDRVLPPRDEAAADPSFVTFRARLLGALAARDTAAVLAAVAPEAKLSFGDDASGPEGFRAMWLDGEAGWGTVAQTVALGSSMPAPGAATAPYYFDAWPDTLDAFGHLVVVGERVNVRAAPSAEGEVLGTLTYAVVPGEAGAVTDGYVPIRYGPDGGRAYVAERFVGSPVGLRAGFEKRDGRWLLTFFLAGD